MHGKPLSSALIAPTLGLFTHRGNRFPIAHYVTFKLLYGDPVVLIANKSLINYGPATSGKKSVVKRKNLRVGDMGAREKSVAKL